MTTRGFRSRFRGLPLLGVLIPVLLLYGCAAPKAARSFTHAAKSHPDRAAWVAAVPSWSAAAAQPDTAALASLLRYWKAPVSAAAVDEWYRNQGPQFAPEHRPVYLARAWDLWACPSAGTPDALKARIRNRVPVLLAMEDTGRTPPRRSLAVVAGYDDVNADFLCYDGSPQPRIVPYAQLESRWRSADNWMLTVCPPDAARWELTAAEHVGRAAFYESKKDYERAIRDYEAALASGVQDPAALYASLGTAHRAAGRADEAESFYRKAIGLDSRNAKAFNNLAYLLAERTNRLDEAASLARTAALLDPTSPMVMDTLGFVLYQQGRYEESAAVLERARARAVWLPASQQMAIAMHLVWAHYRGGQLHLAREVLAEVLGMDPAFPVPEELRPLVPSDS